MVSLTYTGANPGTVMVMNCHTNITKAAVERPWSLDDVAGRAFF
jgi:hypothetical protein